MWIARATGEEVIKRTELSFCIAYALAAPISILFARDKILLGAELGLLFMILNLRATRLFVELMTWRAGGTVIGSLWGQFFSLIVLKTVAILLLVYALWSAEMRVPFLLALTVHVLLGTSLLLFSAFRGDSLKDERENK